MDVSQISFPQKHVPPSFALSHRQHISPNRSTALPLGWKYNFYFPCFCIISVIT
jgi:hypothetical protein